MEKDANTPWETIYDVDGRTGEDGGDPHETGKTSKAIINIFNRHETYRINGSAGNLGLDVKMEEYEALGNDEIYGAGCMP
ncbi:MAG: hypothetical protein GF344_04510 [Chitinivibrionales bacterium]|nr:hypothetical protein [Chitinivibrionales bacterium]